jgi:hypothetical protein
MGLSLTSGDVYIGVVDHTNTGNTDMEIILIICFIAVVSSVWMAITM